MKETKQTPRYSILSSCAFMIRQAWTSCRLVLWVSLGQAATAVGANLLALLMGPALLGLLETGAPLPALLRTLGGFVLAGLVLYCAIDYLATIEQMPWIVVRQNLFYQVEHKYFSTSYCHMADPAFLARTSRVIQLEGRGSRASSEQIWPTLVSLLTNLICFVIYMVLLAGVALWVPVLAAAAAAAGYWLGRGLRQWGYRHKDQEDAALHKLSYASAKARDLKLAKDIRIFGLQGWMQDLFDSSLAVYQDFCFKKERHQLWADLLDLLLAFARNGIAYGYLVYITAAGRLSAAEFLLYFSAVSGFSGWVSGILSDFVRLSQQCVDLSALKEYLSLPEPYPLEGGKPLDIQPHQPCRLELRDVSYRYPEAERDTISHMNLTIAPGEKLAIVGLNGAGKTTLIKLLCGFLEPTGGQVLLNGQDIRQYNRRDYYKLFSAVFQKFVILPGTIAENVAQRRTEEGIDRDRVWQCIRQAGLTDKIASLPQGLDTKMVRTVYEDAVELSGGETQRLMLARALYKNGPVLVLDEPTAALDPIAEDDIYRKYDSMTAGNTSIFISHRLASTRFCDRILLLDHGSIAEEGTHDQLLARGGKYAQLFALQSRYYQKGAIQNESC